MRVIDDTESDIRALIEKDFGPLEKVQDGSRDFIDWLHFKARSIPRVPRNVLLSDEVKEKLGQFPAIQRIGMALQMGADVSGWLHERLRTDKKDHRGDMLFNDWQISHFHLGNVFATPTSINRTKPVLFAHITHAQAVLLDVQAHGRSEGRTQWTRTALLEILLRTDPKAGFQLKGVTASRLTDDQYSNLRSNGANAAIEIEGKIMMPSMGISSSGHATRIVLYGQWFRRQLGALKAGFEKDEVPAHLKQAIYRTLGVPIRLGVRYDDRGLAIIDKNRSGLVLHQMRPAE